MLSWLQASYPCHPGHFPEKACRRRKRIEPQHFDLKIATSERPRIAQVNTKGLAAPIADRLQHQ
jgi:hypothetical protein